MHKTKMAGKTAKLNCTLTSTTTTNTIDTKCYKKTGLNFCHTNTGLPKKCRKDGADTVRQSWQFFAIYQNRSQFALLDTFKNRHCLDSLPKQIELIQGLSWKSFHCRFTEIRQCEQYYFISGRTKLCLFNTFHSNRIKNMIISFLTFPLYKSQKQVRLA